MCIAIFMGGVFACSRVREFFLGKLFSCIVLQAGRSYVSMQKCVGAHNVCLYFFASRSASDIYLSGAVFLFFPEGGESMIGVKGGPVQLVLAQRSDAQLIHGLKKRGTFLPLYEIYREMRPVRLWIRWIRWCVSWHRRIRITG